MSPEGIRPGGEISTTLKHTGAVLFGAGQIMATPVAATTAAHAAPEHSSITGSVSTPEPDLDRLPLWAFEALHFRPTTAAEVEACWDEHGDVIIQIYPPPCRFEPISNIEFQAASILWFFTSRLGSS